MNSYFPQSTQSHFFESSLLQSSVQQSNKNFFPFSSSTSSNTVSPFFEEDKNYDPKYKTELCKKFQTTGKCPYGYKCRFAHGKEELISKHLGNNYKKKFCKSFTQKGFCPYGSRCSFKHDEKKFDQTVFGYYYLKHFLFNYSNFKSLYENNINITNKRLKVFQELTDINIKANKISCSTFNVNKLEMNNNTIINCLINTNNSEQHNSSLSTISIDEKNITENNENDIEENEI